MEEKEIYLLITRYLAKHTSIEENEWLADWIAKSAKNEQTFEDLKTMWLASKPTDNLQTHAALSKLKRKINQEQQNQKLTMGLNRKWLAVAASIIGLLIIAGTVYHNFLTGPPAAKYVEQVTGAGQKKMVYLPDGTRVFLAPQSSLIFPVKLSSGKRMVKLRGQAYFEVSKNPHRPFIVHTPALNVQVLGTHFNVRSYNNQNLVKVSLLEGKVKVTITDDSPDEYFLKPGQELSVNPVNHQVYQHEFDTMAAIGWMTNTLVFKNEKLGDAAERIEQMYNVKIVFTDQATADSRLYATFKNESLKNVLETISATGNITYSIEGHKVYLNLKP